MASRVTSCTSESCGKEDYSSEARKLKGFYSEFVHLALKSSALSWNLKQPFWMPGIGSPFLDSENDLAFSSKYLATVSIYVEVLAISLALIYPKLVNLFLATALTSTPKSLSRCMSTHPATL